MPDLIEDIKQRYGILDLLRKTGIPIPAPSSNNTYFIKSIYREEKTPSLCVYANQNRFHCFSTGISGDIIDFYKDYYRVDVKQAIKELAEIAGISPETYHNHTERGPEKKRLDSLLNTSYLSALNKEESVAYLFAIEFLLGAMDREVIVTEELKKTIISTEKKALKPIQLARLEQNKEVLKEFREYCIQGNDNPCFEYLVNTRGIPYRQLASFKIFFIYDYHKVNNHMKKTFPMVRLQQAGLFNKGKEDPQKGNLIFYNHRIIIPYLHNGEIVYLRARYFDDKNNPKSDSNKYLGLINDPLNLNTAKRFYNFDVTRKMLPGERLFITEGEFDAIALESLGYNTIAIPGAANLPDKKFIDLILNYDITICPDNDEAGRKLVDRLKDEFFARSKGFHVKQLPENIKDINDFLKAS